ncbi:cupredoxin domain-containing protein [Candidatus Microgenomates bacterium]|nr:cupredoxin domain-containing protein [Candidatus Microgenomates bacterium]
MKKYKNYQSGFIVPLLILATVLMAGIFGYLYLQSPQTYKPPVLKQVQKKINIEEAVNSPAEVTITRDGFTPATISIVAGQSITFVNQNKAAHRIVSYPKTAINNLSEFDSEDLQPTDSFTYSFEKIGKFTVADSYNPSNYKVTIIVQ